MPNKTIYVADGDLPLFDRAQELTGGNLSATITRAPWFDAMRAARTPPDPAPMTNRSTSSVICVSP